VYTRWEECEGSANKFAVNRAPVLWVVWFKGRELPAASPLAALRAVEVAFFLLFISSRWEVKVRRSFDRAGGRSEGEVRIAATASEEEEEGDNDGDGVRFALSASLPSCKPPPTLSLSLIFSSFIVSPLLLWDGSCPWG